VSRAFSQGIYRPGQEADHSPRTNAEAVNEWTYTFTPPQIFRRGEKITTLYLVEGWTPFTQHYTAYIPVHLFPWYFTVRVVEKSQIVSLSVERWQDMLFVFTDFKHEMNLTRKASARSDISYRAWKGLNYFLRNHTSKMASDANSNNQFFKDICTPNGNHTLDQSIYSPQVTGICFLSFRIPLWEALFSLFVKLSCFLNLLIPLFMFMMTFL
jgi:hypothetical protein